MSNTVGGLEGSVIKCLAGDPEKALVGGRCGAGEERPNPEMLSRVRVAVKSCLGLYCICIKPTNVVGTGLSLVGP